MAKVTVYRFKKFDIIDGDFKNYRVTPVLKPYNR